MTAEQKLGNYSLGLNETGENDSFGRVVRRNNTNIEPHSYEEFSNRPFYVEIDSYTVSKAPVARRIIDNTAGTGAMILRLSEQDKLAEGFQVVAYDRDADALKSIMRNLEPQGGEIRVAQADAAHLPVPDNWAEVELLCNSIHLMDKPEEVLAEAYRTLQPGGVLVINSAYEKLKGYGDTKSKRALGITVGGARSDVAKLGYVDIPHGVDYLRYTAGNIIDNMVQAGFADVHFETKAVKMDRDDMKAIYSYKDFTEGALPTVPFDVASKALIDNNEPSFERFKVDHLNRNWGIWVATKPL